VTWDRSAYFDEQTSANLYMNDDHQSKFGAASVRDSSPESGTATFRGDDTQIRYYDEKTGNYQRASGPYSASIEVRRSKVGALDGAWQGSIEASQSSSLNAKFVD
jgi:hypothetical protein